MATDLVGEVSSPEEDEITEIPKSETEVSSPEADESIELSKSIEAEVDSPEEGEISEIPESGSSLEPLSEPSDSPQPTEPFIHSSPPEPVPAVHIERASSPPDGAVPPVDPSPVEVSPFSNEDEEEFVDPPIRSIEKDQDDSRVYAIDRSYSFMTPKVFLGGYRNTKTGVEYLHASSQTPPLTAASVSRVQKYHRESQTIKVANASYQPPRDASTQMARTNVYWLPENGETATDKIIVARPYFTAEQLAELKWKSAIRIQRQMRGFLARRRASKLRAKVEAKKARLRQEEIDRANQAQAIREFDMERRRHPKTKEDFELLYAELEAWCANEKKRIDGLGLSKEDRQQALKELLNKETQLLQTIDRLKQKAALEAKQVRVEETLDSISHPKEWDAQVDPGINAGKSTVKAQVETPFTQRARELRDIYTALCNQYPTQEERLEALVQVKWTVQEFDCKLTRDIIELVDREGDLLDRGRPDSALTGLRQRLSNLFLQFIEAPEFNPEIARTQKIDLRYRTNVQPLKPRYRTVPKP
eukprot:TRINITY_DN7605_c0_g1_i1.p1 TRINITY_DN7605_c0_g1~~TRINITY_DN7605_c0_g1_i1.p1  ORF type:complete len:547 (-),score=139.08 TRINITY_DN7605_c0_g1_i1:453-2048(-)